MDNNLDKIKYKNIVLFFIKNCRGEHLGKVKLNKLFYYLDFISYRDRGKTITGDIYRHKQLGPVPEHLQKQILPELENEGKIEITPKSIKNGDYISNSYEILKDPDMSCFDEQDINLIESVCEKFNYWTDDELIQQTHFEAPWFYSDSDEELNLEYSKDIEFLQMT
jgi:uncharacterized phage-associated protein